MLDSDTIRQTFIDFFVDRGHNQIDSSSLLPADGTVLFTSAGMQQLIPYFSGASHPSGRRLVDWQRVLRTVDIDEVGDASHLTMFEMLGSWSLGDYGPDLSLQWSLELLCERFGLDVKRLSVTVFAGDDEVPFDRLAYERWRSLGIAPERIHRYGRAENWWGPVGPRGPCGPDSEIFVWTGDGEPESEPARDDRWLETWNNVFITWELTGDGRFVPLAQRNVDTGMGFERLVALLQGVGSVYDTDLLAPVMSAVDRLAGDGPLSSRRIVCDHVRAATFLIADGVLPSNVERGYVLRRLIRRAIRHGRLAGVRDGLTGPIAAAVIERFGSLYPVLALERSRVLAVLAAEEERFGRVLDRGLRELDRLVARGDPVDGSTLFWLFETHGLPPEMSTEELRRRGVAAGDWQPGFLRAQQRHQARSQAAAGSRFGGGLEAHTDRAVRLHTATHLLGGALRRVLGDHVHQRGSSITDERLRFDFSHDRRLSEDELSRVSEIVNRAIADDLPVQQRSMPREQAERLGAEREFGQRYPDTVSVYTIGDLSTEFCGGPHVARTGEVGRFRILKQESSGAGVRRIRATVE
ncbi:MAG TPA: alanine--tRNA ligase [Solirubrobacteraceae bacterium]|nr:alanine--tRNA ligase [Solirubrobacteraceae bacterium]